MKEERLDFPDYDPEFEVWNHIESGLDLAASELNRLPSRERQVVEQVGALIATLRTDFALPSDQQEVVAILDALLANAWFRHGADLELAKEGVYRASAAVDRFKELKPVYTSYRPSPRPKRYLAEAVHAFVFGFDAPCIAFCGASLERVLQDALERAGVMEPSTSLEDRTPPAARLLRLAKEQSLIDISADAAKRLFEQRHRVMHRHVWDDRIVKSVALQSIADLAAVLEESPAFDSTEPGA